MTGNLRLVPGVVSELRDVELSEVEAVVGSRSFKRGRGYARGDRVASIEWDPNAETLTGSVVGEGALYSTAAFFAADHDGALAFGDGECSCPVGHNCKHVAAIVI
ncbi:MAG: SWIM zinc finger family protein, partial [Solirubrobacterales bacterium]